MINLVSDANMDGASWANAGVTLPNGEHATHNINLSPFFFLYGGRPNGGRDQATIERALVVYIWSANAQSSNFAFFALSSDSTVYPSIREAKARGHSLRCLVSNTNS